MKTKVTLRELSPIVQSLNNFVQIPMPAKYSWRLSRVMKKLQSEIEDFQKSRLELVKQFGEVVDEDDNPVEGADVTMPNARVRIKQDQLEQFTTELEDLLNETIELSFQPIPLSLVMESNMTIADMANLEIFFEDDIDFDEDAVEPEDVTEVHSPQEEVSV